MPGPARSSRPRAALLCLLLAILAVAPETLTPSAFGDDFGRITGPALFEIPRRSKDLRTAHLSVRTIESMPEVVRGERAALVIATTDQGNLSKLLVSPGLRRPATGGDKTAMVSVINLERFETVDSGDRVTWKARGRDVLLFDGFEFDLDTGQVVPPGFGGDIRYSSRGEAGPELTALGQNALYPIDKPPPVPPSEPGRPSPGPAVVPADFQGRYTLIANGQTSGSLEIAVDAAGAVTGRFRSDRNGAVYPVSGTVAADLPRRIEFEIKFPRHATGFRRPPLDGREECLRRYRPDPGASLQLRRRPGRGCPAPRGIRRDEPAPRPLRAEVFDPGRHNRRHDGPLHARWSRQVRGGADRGPLCGRQGRSVRRGTPSCRARDLL